MREEMKDEYELEEIDISNFTSSITGSTDPMSGLIENRNSESFSLIDNDEKKMQERPKRGRKRLRPNDPIRTKTEEKDKFWLRAFRSYMRKYIEIHWAEFCNNEKLF